MHKELKITISPPLKNGADKRRKKLSFNGWMPKTDRVVKDILFHITPQLLTQSPLCDACAILQ